MKTLLYWGGSAHLMLSVLFPYIALSLSLSLELLGWGAAASCARVARRPQEGFSLGLGGGTRQTLLFPRNTHGEFRSLQQCVSRAYCERRTRTLTGSRVIIFFSGKRWLHTCRKKKTAWKTCGLRDDDDSKQNRTWKYS